MTELDAPNLNSLWATLLIEELVRQGAGYFVLPSGSRSAPLTAAVAARREAAAIHHFDERGAAFHALGWGRATGRPAVLITTSGTAVANAWPAVVEASMDRVPLILLTADRPPELRDTGASQTIDQAKIYAPYARWQVDLPCPDRAIRPEMILTTVDQAVYRARRSPQGPVHINCMFREPLAPIPQGEDYTGYLAGLAHWRQTHAPFTDYPVPDTICADPPLKALAETLGRVQRGLVVIGSLGDPQQLPSIRKLVGKLGWPVLPDISSGLRLGNADSPMIPHADAILAAKEFPDRNRAAAVLHLGGRLLSKRLLDYLQGCGPRPYIAVEDHPARSDPLHAVSLRVDGHVGRFCDSLVPYLRPRGNREWLDGWREASRRVGKALDGLDGGELSEPLVARIVSKLIGSDHGLFLAASMPVRDVDTFAVANGASPLVACNRGAVGIDGILATATGFARGLERPVTVLMGDLALLHDLNSLNFLRTVNVPMVVVVLNNNGGGIFSFLPIAQFRDVFEPYFGTPHNLTFEGAARMFEVNYDHPTTGKTFAEAYEQALRNQRASLIEVTTTREENHQLHLSLLDTVVSSLKGS